MQAGHLELVHEVNTLYVQRRLGDCREGNLCLKADIWEWRWHIPSSSWEGHQMYAYKHAKIYERLYNMCIYD